MKRQEPLFDSEDEVRELTSKDAAKAVPFSALPEAERQMLLSFRGDVRRGAAKTRAGKTLVRIHEDPSGHRS